MYDVKDVNLTNCDREPIHIPGSIQPHGCLIACDQQLGDILRTSANTASFLGLGDVALNGRQLSDVLEPEFVHMLRNAAATASEGGRGVVLVNQPLRPGGDGFDIVVHRYKGVGIIEFEHAGAATAGGPLETARALISTVARIGDLAELYAKTPRLLRGVLGYDRVMVYQFGHDGAGKVIGEAKRSDLEGFKGAYFPASDIPQQARRLYLQNRIRVISDANCARVPIEPEHDASGEPLDLSYAHLRSVSPIHCEYLRNMGVGASMSISIVVDGQLWGLIACHHYGPRVLSLAQRVAAEMFGEFFSLQIEAMSRKWRLDSAARARRSLDRIMRDASYQGDIIGFLQNKLEDFTALLPCDGGGALRDLLESELRPYRDAATISLNGPDLGFDARAYSVLALVLHELATNAAKYGALSQNKGQLTVEWRLTDDESCEINWLERGGPTTVAPKRQGFGSVLLTRSIPFDLGDESELHYESAGVRARFVIPANFVSQLRIEKSKSRAQQQTQDHPSLEGLKVPLLEDQLVIALDAEAMLQTCGVGSVDTTATAAEALRTLVATEPNIAVLDVNLGSGNSFPVAEELRRRNIPFIFATGYGDHTIIPKSMADVPVVRKPYDPDALATTMARALAGGRDA